MANQKQTQRINFSAMQKQMPYPDFLEIQLKSFHDFFQMDSTPEVRHTEGLFKVFSENFPIQDTRNNFTLEFLDYHIDPPRYSIEECLLRGLTYSVPLKAKLFLTCTDPDHEDFEPVLQEVFLGNIPYMTPKGTFVINGAERVIVSQLHRSPGVFFGTSMHSNGTKLYSARIIPFRGSWIEFATDINRVMYAYIDRKKKLPVTTLLRAIGFESDKDILDCFGLAEEIKCTKENLDAVVGRTLAGNVLKGWTEDFVDEDTGEVVTIERNEVIIERETVLTEELCEDILESGTKTILLHKEEANESDYSIIFNTLQKDPSHSEKEAVLYIYRQLRNAEPADDATAREAIHNLFFSEKRYDLGEVGRYRINRKLNMDIPMETRTLTKEDMIEIIKYLVELINSNAEVDDIDHLSNRRVRTVGEQLYNQFGIGLARMARTIRERMNVRDTEVFTPTDLINAKAISSVINSYFGTNALSQFMDQQNPLAEITHKRRMSALGPGGLSRDRAGFEVRDVHYTHYGRLCPIETPEGPNIGLISSLCVYAKINDLGFIETPYRKVENGVVNLNNDEVAYYTAEDEEQAIVAQGNAPLDKDGKFIRTKVKSRFEADFPVVAPSEVNLMDVSPSQIASIAASLIPFLEHDDANRALMGSNMMRQGVPLLRSEAPIVGTGIEAQLIQDSRTQIMAEGDGVVTYLGERSDTGLLKPFSFIGFNVEIDSLRNFALAFVTLRAVFNFIPQLCHLTFSNDMTTYYARRIYTPLEISMLIAVAVCGLAFAVYAIAYIIRVKRCGGVANGIAGLAVFGGVANGIAGLAGEERLAEIKIKAGAKAHVRALLVLAVAMLFNIDIALDTSGGFNIMPRFIFAVLLLISVWGFMEHKWMKVGAAILTLLYSVTSLFTMSQTSRFHENFVIKDLITNMFAKEAYAKIEATALVELILFLSVVGYATAVLIMAVRRHTGLSPNEEEYSRVAKQRHRELSLRVIGFSVLLALTGVMKYVNILLIGSPVKFDVQDMPTELGGGNSGPIYAARLPWFGTVSTIVCILLVLYTFYLVGILRDEVRMKYNLPRKGDD